MTKRLLTLRNVPDDEAREVREMLDDLTIAYYETPPSRWGISMGGIWIRSDADFSQARTALDRYQVERALRARAEYQTRLRSGEAETFATVLRQRPVQVVAYIAIAGGIILLMLWPIWVLMN